MENEFQTENPVNLNNRKPSWLKRPRTLIIGGLIVLAVIIGIVSFFVIKNASSESADKPSVNINQVYTITAKTIDKKLTDGKLKLRVTNATYADSILVTGQVATPVKGKTFLIINMEIENPYKVSLYAFPVDLFRFVRSDGALFAPSVHQGTVEIRAQSTKKSNIAFVVLPTDKKFTIEVGEIGQAKKTLEIHF
jgi:hypothetical protein